MRYVVDFLVGGLAGGLASYWRARRRRKAELKPFPRPM